MDEKVKVLMEWFKGKKLGPYLLEVWPTNRCNLRCIMCGTWAHARSLNLSLQDLQKEWEGEMSDQKFLEIVNECCELGTKEILITGGGEPFVRKSLVFEMMKIAKAHGLRGFINTNGTLLEEKDVKKIVSLGWDVVIISIDGHNSEIHDYIRGVKGTFEKLKRILTLFKEEKKRLGTDKPEISFNTVIHKFNYNRLDKLIEFAKEMECSSITFIPLIIYDEYVARIALNDEDKQKFKKLIDKFIKIANRLNVQTNLPSIKNELFNKKKDKKDYTQTNTSAVCFEPFLHAVVKPGGHVSPCCMIYGEINIKDKSFKDVWYGEYFQRLRNEFLKGRLPEDCRHCVFSLSTENKRLMEKLQSMGILKF